MQQITIESVAQSSSSLSLGNDLALVDDVHTINIPEEARRMGCFLFGFCDKGKAQYTIDTMQQTVTAGHCIIVSYGQVLSDVIISSDCEARAVFISQQYVQEVLTGIRDLSSIFLFSRLHPVFSMSREDARSILSFYLLIRQKVSETDHRFRHDTVRSLLQAFLYDAGNIFWKVFNNEDFSNSKKDEGNKPHLNARAEEIFIAFIELVEKNFNKERRVGWYAQKLAITPKYLSETVRMVSHKTPNEWIDNYVILEIRVALKNTNLTIKEIAAQMNFPNQSFLGKYFKEHTGMSPKEYRNN